MARGTLTCTLAVCGDGVRERLVEECDDGDASSGDGCSATCDLEGTGGYVVFIGHDFFATNPTSEELLANAVLLSAVANDLTIVGYAQYADLSAGGEVVNTESAIAAELADAGVDYTISRTVSMTVFMANLETADVAIIYEQEISGFDPEYVAELYEEEIRDFVEGGGILIAMSFAGDEWEVLDHPGLFDVDESVVESVGSTLLVNIGSTVSYTRTRETRANTDDINAGCGNSASEPDTQFYWVAPSAGTYRFTTEGSGDETTISLWTPGTECVATLLGCDANAATRGGTLTRAMTAGEEIIIVVDSNVSTGGWVTYDGDYTLNITRP